MLIDISHGGCVGLPPPTGTQRPNDRRPPCDCWSVGVPSLLSPRPDRTGLLADVWLLCWRIQRALGNCSYAIHETLATRCERTENTIPHLIVSRTRVIRHYAMCRSCSLSFALRLTSENVCLHRTYIFIIHVNSAQCPPAARVTHHIHVAFLSIHGIKCLVEYFMLATISILYMNAYLMELAVV